MKRCSQVRRLRERGFLQRLTLDEEFTIEHHAAGCPQCAKLFDAEEQFDRRLQDLPEAPVERLDIERSTAAIWARVDEIEKAPVPGHGRRVVAIAATVAAVVSLSALWRMVTMPGPTTPVVETARVVEGSPEVAEGDLAHAPLLEPADVASADERTASRVVLEASDLDRLRLDEARAQVRAQLMAVGESFTTDRSRADVVQRVEQLDESLASNLGSWPVRRIVEGLATDVDPTVARAALRYLGVRGDTASIRVLERALRDADLSRVAVEALCDRGDRGLAGLSWAFWYTPHAERVTQHIAQLAAQDIASNRACQDWARSAARGASSLVSDERGGALLALLEDIESTGDQTRGLEFLFELVSDPRWRKTALEALAGRDQAEAYLMTTLTDDGPAYPEPVRLDVIERLGSVTALPWLERTCRRGEQPERALMVLAAIDGVDVIESLIYLRRDFTPERFAAAWRAAIQHDAERFTDHAWRAVERGGRAELGTYLDLLLAHEPARVVSAICALASSDMLADDDRERALLIAGELGQLADLDALRITFDMLEHDDRDLAAACLWSARRMGGLVDDAAVRSWLGDTYLQKRQRVLELLPESALSSDGALRRFRLARELESVLSIRDESDRFTRSASFQPIGGTTP